jgi:hypothetical protein
MLWLHGQLSPLPTMRDLLLPSLVSLVVPLSLLQAFAPEFRPGGGAAAALPEGKPQEAEPQPQQDQQQQQQRQPVPGLSLALSSSASLDGGPAADPEAIAFEEASQRGPLVLAVGVCALLSVPAFKYLTGAPEGCASQAALVEDSRRAE